MRCKMVHLMLGLCLVLLLSGEFYFPLIQRKLVMFIFSWMVIVEEFMFELLDCGRLQLLQFSIRSSCVVFLLDL